MKILIDMNLSPKWVSVFEQDGLHAVHLLHRFESELEQGALITADRERSRARILPLG